MTARVIAARSGGPNASASLGGAADHSGSLHSNTAARQDVPDVEG
jgi:hypothetical protein